MKNLSDRHIIFLVFGVVVGYGMLSYPKDLAQIAGSGGWLSLVVSTAIALLTTYIIVHLGFLYENKTLDEYSKLIIGKYISYIFVFLYIVYFFLVFTYITRILTEVIKLTILFNTPIWALMILILLVVYYAITKGIIGLARLCEIYGFIIIIVSFLVFLLIFTQGKYINLRPFLVLRDFNKYLKAVTLVIPFLGIEILTILPIKKKLNTSIYKYLAIMLLIIGLLYILEYFACLSIIGIEDIVYYKNALIAVVRRVDLPFLQFLERIDGIVISIWIMATFCTISIFSYGTVFYLKKVFKNIKFNFLGLIVITTSFIMGQIPNTFEEVEKVIQYAGFLGVITSLVIPLTLFIVSKVKNS